ncbi:hypothetical protein WMY93_019505 [Mugilogobius chulae]|uniref:Arf-GAP domain-containing protein n=1 Tax=Mugilogobius chulae TaxID=88201 RepID=A0AAW0NQF5_9GOBI
MSLQRLHHRTGCEKPKRPGSTGRGRSSCALGDWVSCTRHERTDGVGTLLPEQRRERLGPPGRRRGGGAEVSGGWETGSRLAERSGQPATVVPGPERRCRAVRRQGSPLCQSPYSPYQCYHITCSTPNSPVCRLCRGHFDQRDVKRLRSREVCADCSAPEPRWASINRGVLICDECCSIHRGLGRHSSQVRHLTHSTWPSSQLQMVQTLYGNGANSIWEHTLLDPSSSSSGKRKANPQDRVHPNKTEFIKAKYQMLAYVHRMPCREDDSVTAKDLSKQLHSSVRTGNLETCLRLLSLGAQANFFHPVSVKYLLCYSANHRMKIKHFSFSSKGKGNTPLHIAAKAGQILQAELLSVYGADPGALDSCGKTPIDYARQAGHHELAERLVEIQYELTDRLTFYLCGRRPDHRNGTHFIIPQMADSLDLSEFAKAAKKKLQSLSNHQFEELAMDVYDEVDRRETDAVWLATQNHSTLVTDTTVIPFLPVNPEYSSTRNQGRQKLARFSAHEFATLVIDILADAKHRQWGNTCESPKNVELILQGTNSRHNSESQDNDQPDYDSVASDEDPVQEATCADSCNDGRTKSSESSDLSDGPITVQEFMEVKTALTASEAKIQQLLKVNCHLSEELRMMQTKLNSLQTENTTLKWQGPSGHQQPQGPSEAVASGRPRSVHIGRGPLGTAASSLPTFPSSLSWSWDERSRRGCSLEGQSTVLENDYDSTPNHSELEDAGSPVQALDTTDPGVEEDSTLPCTEDVICKTEQITKNIQELLRAAQETKHDSFLPCSEKICVAVTEMAALFPKRPSSETVRGSLCLLTSSATSPCECQKAAEHCPCPSDIQLVTQQVIQCAYDIAKAAKQLVTMVQTLYGNGANSIWEHTLLDPSSSSSGKRKATLKTEFKSGLNVDQGDKRGPESVNVDRSGLNAGPESGLNADRVRTKRGPDPNKTEFIKAKYQMLAYVHRMPCREDDSVTAKDLSKEKGNTPLHIAAKAGQILQAELLSVYGADPGALDSCGKTPIDYARQAGHHELAERLVEIQYELTDRLTLEEPGANEMWSLCPKQDRVQAKIFKKRSQDWS